jgi:hypothetical protein
VSTLQPPPARRIDRMRYEPAPLSSTLLRLTLSALTLQQDSANWNTVRRVLRRSNASGPERREWRRPSWPPPPTLPQDRSPSVPAREPLPDPSHRPSYLRIRAPDRVCPNGCPIGVARIGASRMVPRRSCSRSGPAASGRPGGVIIQPFARLDPSPFRWLTAALDHGSAANPRETVRRAKSSSLSACRGASRNGSARGRRSWATAGWAR